MTQPNVWLTERDVLEAKGIRMMRKLGYWEKSVDSFGKTENGR